jgi:hypothetical protein
MDFTWEKAAAMGEAMPTCLPTAEQKAFQAIAYLYARYRTGVIEKEQAAAEKRQIKASLADEIAMENFQDNLAYQREMILRQSEMAKIACRKEPTPENAIALCDKIDAIMKDERFENVKHTDYGANCPVCSKFFNDDHASRRPRFCEDCGAKLGW